MTNQTNPYPMPPIVVQQHELDPASRDKAIGAAIGATSDWVKTVVPVVPTAGALAYAALAVRVIMMVGGSVGATWAEGVTGDRQQQLAFILAAVGGALWTAYRKWRSDRERAEIARASGAASADVTARTGVPTIVPVQPPPSVL